MSRFRIQLWFFGCVALAVVSFALFATSMPGSSYRGARLETPPSLRESQLRLRGHVSQLSTGIGARNAASAAKLTAAREYIHSVLVPLASSTANIQLEKLEPEGEGAQNLIFEVAGRQPSPIVVVGAHYDSAYSSPGANDNASGVAAALEVASALANRPATNTVRVVFFANEEPPFFKRPGMGSRTSAQNARRRGERISAMVAVETVGFYTEQAGSQQYPWPIGLLYPSRGNFLAFVGDLGSRALVRRAIRAFRESTKFPSEGAALPATLPGVDWSDHASFRDAGYPAIMITDTAIYRDPHYHRTTDTAEHLDYDALARVTAGIEAVVRQLANGSD